MNNLLPVAARGFAIILQYTSSLFKLKGRILGLPIIFNFYISFAGTLTFFFSAFTAFTIAYYYYLQPDSIEHIGLAFLISMATTIAEAKSSKDYDNFFVITIALIVMYIADIL